MNAPNCREENSLPAVLCIRRRKNFLKRKKRAVVVALGEVLAGIAPRYCYKTVTKRFQNRVRRG